MPKERSVGYGEFTALKERQYTDWIDAHMRMVKGILGNPKCRAVQAYHLFDLTAGTGYCDGKDGEPGSALIAPRTAARVGVPLRGWFFERDTATFSELSANIDTEQGDLRLVAGDHNQTLPELAEQFAGEWAWRYGLVYWDASGDGRFPCETIRYVVSLPCFHVLDVLIYISPANIKRCIGRGYEAARIGEIVERTGKRFAHVRHPVGQHQWTFLALTNWEKMPRFEKLGFRRVDTPEGAAILNRLSFSEKERKAQAHWGQPTLFDDVQVSLFDPRNRVRR